MEINLIISICMDHCGIWQTIDVSLRFTKD